MKKSNIAKIALVFILIGPMFAGPVKWVKGKVLHKKSYAFPKAASPKSQNPSRDAFGRRGTFRLSSFPSNEGKTVMHHYENTFPSGLASQDTGSHTITKKESKHLTDQTNQGVSVSTPPVQVKSKKRTPEKKTVQGGEKLLLASTSGVSLATAGSESNDVLLGNPLSKQSREDSPKTLEMLKQFVTTRPPLSKVQLAGQADRLEESAQTAISFNTPDYNRAIRKLLVARDERNGIERRIIKRGQDGDSVRIRDARNRNVHDEENPRAAYGAQYLNQVRIAEQLIKSEGKKAGLNPDDIRERIQMLARRARKNLHNILNSENLEETIGHVNTDLADFATVMGLKKPDKKIGWGKDFMNLHYEHYYAATVYTISDRKGRMHTVIESGAK